MLRRLKRPVPILAPSSQPKEAASGSRRDTPQPTERVLLSHQDYGGYAKARHHWSKDGFSTWREALRFYKDNKPYYRSIRLLKRGTKYRIEMAR